MGSRRNRVVSLILASLLLGACVTAALYTRPSLELRRRVDAVFTEGADVSALASELEAGLKAGLADEDHEALWLLLRERLADHDPRVRQVAAWTMARVFGAQVVRYPGDHMTAAESALIRLCAPQGPGDPGPGGGSLRAADDPDRIVRRELEDRAQAAEIALALLRELRESRDPLLRWRVARTVGFLAEGDHALMNELLAHLEREDDPRVLQLLLRVLGGFDLDPPRRQIAAFPAGPLERALASPDRALRLAATRARGAQDLSDAQRGALHDDVWEAIGSADAAESPSQQAAWAEADALYLIPQLDPRPAELARVLREEWLQAAESLEARRGSLRLAFRRLGPTWTDALEGLLDQPRPQHFPDSLRANFVGPRWCEDDQEICPGELPWLALLANDPRRAFCWLGKPPSRSAADPAGRKAWLWIAVDEAGQKLAPRRLPLLRFADGPAPRAAAAEFLRAWPAAQGALTSSPAQTHWLKTISRVSADLCFAAATPEAVAALATFSEAELPAEFAPEQRLAGLGADLVCRAVPRELLTMAAGTRARLRRRLSDPKVVGAQRALLALNALSAPEARGEVRRALEGLVAAGPCESPEDELMVLWAFARARRLGVDVEAMTAALSSRLPQLFLADDWPYEGSSAEQELALAMLGQLSPQLRAEGRAEIANRAYSFEAVPLDMHWGTFDALAAELGAVLPEDFEDDEPLQIAAAGDGDEALTPLALAFSVRSLSKLALDPLELRLRLWGLAWHLAANPPLDHQSAGGWLLALESLGGVLESLGDPVPLPALAAPTPEEVEAATQLLQRVR